MPFIPHTLARITHIILSLMTLNALRVDCDIPFDPFSSKINSEKT